MTPLTLIPIAPRSTAPCPAFVMREGRGCRLEMVSTPSHAATPEGDALRALRLSRNLSLRDAATLCALSIVDLSGLEHGRYTLSDEDWQALRALLESDRGDHAPN